MRTHSGLEEVDVAELKGELDGYLERSEAVAVVRGGQTLGYFIPAGRRPSEEEIGRLERMAERVRQWMTESGWSEEDILREFEAERRGN